jgi:hypothetical protein
VHATLVGDKPESTIWTGDFAQQSINLWETAGFNSNSLRVRFSLLDIYRLAFSPCGSYLLVIRGLDEMYRDYCMQGWVLELYSSSMDPGRDRAFKYIKTRSFFPAEAAELHLFDRYIVFHPHLPVLVLAQRQNCLLWHFYNDSKY